MKRVSKTLSIVAVAGTAILAHAPVVSARAANLPSRLAIAGASQGSINYAVSAAIATVITRFTPMQTTVIPFTGTAGIMPAVANGDPPLGTSAGTPLTFKSYLTPENYARVSKNFRILSAGTPNQITLAVLESSGITSASQIKGKRITAKFSALPECQMHATAMLKDIGLTWNDVVSVPVTSIVQAARALQEGRVEVMACASPAMRGLREVDARTPVRFLSIDGSPAAMARAESIFPYRPKPTTLPKGAFGWLREKATFLTYPWYLYGNKNMSDDVAYAVVKALWDHNSDLRKIHPIMRGWVHKNMVIDNAPVPYDKGAIRFYKEKGVWTAALEAHQKKLLEQ